MTDRWWQAPLWHDCRLDGEPNTVCGHPHCPNRATAEIELYVGQPHRDREPVGVYYRCQGHSQEFMDMARSHFEVPVTFAIGQVNCLRAGYGFPSDIPDLGALV